MGKNAGDDLREGKPTLPLIYLMEHGNLRVLLQPAELVIIGGASIGTVLIGNPLYILKGIAGGIAGTFGGYSAVGAPFCSGFCPAHAEIH